MHQGFQIETFVDQAAENLDDGLPPGKLAGAGLDLQTVPQ